MWLTDVNNVNDVGAKHLKQNWFLLWPINCVRAKLKILKSLVMNIILGEGRMGVSCGQISSLFLYIINSANLYPIPIYVCYSPLSTTQIARLIIPNTSYIYASSSWAVHFLISSRVFLRCFGFSTSSLRANLANNPPTTLSLNSDTKT